MEAHKSSSSHGVLEICYQLTKEFFIFAGTSLLVAFTFSLHLQHTTKPSPGPFPVSILSTSRCKSNAELSAAWSPKWLCQFIPAIWDNHEWHPSSSAQTGIKAADIPIFCNGQCKHSSSFQLWYFVASLSPSPFEPEAPGTLWGHRPE